MSRDGLDSLLHDFYSSSCSTCPLELDMDSTVSKSCIKNCKSNPNCLNSLGFQNWFKPDAMNHYCERLGISDTIPLEKDIRIPSNEPAGLRNLGATCYLNALLQTWFSLHSFRQGLYDYERSNIASDNAIQYLASTFASLQLTSLKVHDPSPFISCLNLQPGIQQDPHEFSKLLLQKIDMEFHYKSPWNV